MKSYVVWDVTSCSELTCRPNLQSKKVRYERNKLKAGNKFILVSYVSYSSTPKMDATCPSKSSLVSQKAKSSSAEIGELV
jgi:hypothetical protein